MTQNESKPFWKSKTVLVNAVVLLASLLPEIQQYVNPTIYIVLICVTNVILRLVSSQKLTK